MFFLRTRYAEAGPDNKININAGKAADAKNASDAYDQILVGRLVKFNGESTKVNGNSFMDSRNINSEPARILGISKGIVTLKKVLLKNYDGIIVIKLISKRDKHDFYYSLDNGLNFILYNSVDAIKTLDANYTGALLGLYTTSNGKLTQDYADYDWVRYKDYVR